MDQKRELAEAGQTLGKLLERAADQQMDDPELWRAIAGAAVRVTAAATKLAGRSEH